MAQISSKEIRRQQRKRRRKLSAKRSCPFCPDGCNRSPRPVYVDYKDIPTLQSMVDRQGRILSHRKTGACAKYQHAVRRAVLRARFLGLIPYVGD